MTRTLSEIDAGQAFTIRDVPDDDVRAQLLRIGLLDGQVRCRTRLRNGPVVVERNGTQLALGASVADEISVEVC